MGLQIRQAPASGPLARHVRRLAGFSEVAPPLRRREVPLAGAVIVFSLGPAMWVGGGWTGCHLTQRFREELVMAPKGFARLLRFEHAVSLMRAGATLADAAHSAGY